jgi:Protein of unknown function (DUF3800)
MIPPERIIPAAGTRADQANHRPVVYIAYVDESGDDGTKRGSSRSYALGCVIIESSSWAATFDGMIDFRRWVNATFRVPVRAELKANYLLHNGGPLRARPLGERARLKLYRAHMRVQDRLGMQAFAVVVDKDEVRAKYPDGTRPTSEIAWEYLLQRLERSFRDSEVLVVHDEGDELTVRKRCRKARRIGSAGSRLGTGRLDVPFRNLLDDPVARDSQQSYFLQLADLNAYAAFRKVYPPTRLPAIVPERMWDFLGEAHFTVVRNTTVYPGPPAIVPGP